MDLAKDVRDQMQRDAARAKSDIDLICRHLGNEIPEYGELARICADAAKQMGKLADNLRDFSGWDAAMVRNVNAHNWVEVERLLSIRDKVTKGGA